MHQREMVLYTRGRSLRCWRARRFLGRAGYGFEVVDVAGDPGMLERLSEAARRKVALSPYVFVDGRPVGDMGEQSNIKQKVEAKNPALRKKRAPNGARGASGATGYLPSPRGEGRKGSRGRYVLSGTHLTHLPWNLGEPGTIEERTKDA